MDNNYSDEQYIGLICNGEFNSIPGIRIGELFEDFFDNINYNVVKEEKTYVDFTGEAVCDNEPCKILIRFYVMIEKDEFEIDKIYVDDVLLNDEEVLDLLDDMAYVCGASFEDEDYNYCDSCTRENCGECDKYFGDIDDDDGDPYTDFDDDEDDDENKF